MSKQILLINESENQLICPLNTNELTEYTK